MDPGTLKAWSGKSLKERTVLFHRNSGKFVNHETLRKLYIKHKIKYRRLKKDYGKGKWTRELIMEEKELLEGIRLKHIEEGRAIVHIDETVFTTNMLTPKDWRYPGANASIKMDKKD